MKNDYSHKKIAVVGFGVEGESVIEYLLNNDANTIHVFDEQEKDQFNQAKIKSLQKKGVTFTFGKIDSLMKFDIIFRSPGISPNRPELQEAQKKGITVTSAIKLFFDECPCQIVGVTGTKGKGTTSTLIYEMLREEGKDAYLGGNIGTPPLSFLPQLTKASVVVLELSSFQLMDLDKSSHIAVMLMTTSEHLDYHADVYEYVEAKRNILRFQTPGDYAIVNKDYPASNESDIYTEGKVYKVSREQDIEQGCFVRDGKIYLKMSEHEEEVMDTKDLILPGKHNWENVCAAVVASIFAGAKMKSIVKVLKSFKGLPHRIELVKTVRGVRYYNDSFSTTPETAVAAIEAFEEPKVLILGGSSKNSDFTHLGEIISDTESIKAIIGIGVEWERIKAQLRIKNSKFRIIEGCKIMQDVVKKASEVATLGDIVLLSPACASFGMFKNYKDRGEQFRREVQLL